MDKVKVPSLSPYTQQTISPIDGLQVVVGEGEVFNHVDQNEYMWVDDGDRVVRQFIEFAIQFTDIPVVSVGITSLDASHAHNQRFRVVVENITRSGFELVFSTWGDTKIARACASWTATGKKGRLYLANVPNHKP